MKKLMVGLLASLLLLTLFSGCAGAQTEEFAAPAITETVFGPRALADGRARPSSCGQLQVLDGKLCGQDGKPVMLRGVSSHDLLTSESFLNESLFRELADEGVNLFRLSMYTYGMGIVGYCSGGDRERYRRDIDKGVGLAGDQDMYVIIDWHILSDGDPNTYLEDAKQFFAEVAEAYGGRNNVLYEICNEPNGVDWPTVKRYAEAVIPVIREKDPDSVILVGNPDWSKDLRSVAADPLPFGNLLYTLHFYAATHGAEVRDMTEQVSRQGLPIFVSEYGVTAASGGLPRNLEEADAWIDLLERENISYCLWSLSKVPEACSMIRASVPKYSGFEEADYTETGLWLLNTMRKHSTR